MGGALLFVAFPGVGFWPAAFLSVALLALSLEEASEPADLLFQGAVYGWVAYVGGYHWMRPALELFWSGAATLSWVIWLLWGVWFSGRFMLFGWAYGWVRGRGGSVWLAMIAPWLTIEWLYPSFFPFFLGNTIVDRSYLVQVVALGGPLLASALLCAVNAAVVDFVQRVHARNRPFGLGTMAALALIAATLGYGYTVIADTETRLSTAPVIRVGVIQANVDVIEKRRDRLLSHHRYVSQSRAFEAQGPADLLIWPETAFLHALSGDLPLRGESVRQGLKAPLLFGGVFVETPDGQRQRFNSSFLADADGLIRSRYDKNLLIPFAEFVPLGSLLPSLAQRAPSAGQFIPGQAKQALQLGPWRIATPICYEAIRPDFVRALMEATDAQLLVSLANDGWFGASAGPRLHLGLARLRAIEHRRYLIRATNSGISAIIDPHGRILSRTGQLEEASLRGDVHPLESKTLYRNFGDWPGPVTAILLALFFVRRRKR